MRNGVRALSFRAKVVLIATLLVIGIQLGTLIPVLSSIRERQETQATETVNRAGNSFDVFMQNRVATLTRVANVIVVDSTFRGQVRAFLLAGAGAGGGAEAEAEAGAGAGARAAGGAGSDQAPSAAASSRGDLEDILLNHARRASSPVAAVFDTGGEFLAGIGDGRSLLTRDVLAYYASGADAADPYQSIAYIDGEPYQTVSVPFRDPVSAPVPSAWVMLGFPVDAALAREISALTRLDSTFVRFGLGRTEPFATTVDPEWQNAALSGLHLGDSSTDAGSVWGAEFITQLRPFLSEDEGLYVAIQLPMMEAMQSYYTLRDTLLLITGIALVATITAAIWLSRKVTRPIERLVEAARRMSEGIYSQPIRIDSDDEFAVLATGFNSMQEAIANRERDIVHMAHHDSLSGLPSREIVVAELRDAIGETDELAVINFVLHRFDELASSLGHRTADRLIQLVAGRLRDELEEGHLLGHLNHQEFVLVLPGAGRAEAERRVQELQTMLRAGLAVGNANISLQIRSGVALYPEHGVNASELLRCAGIARGKSSHRQGSIGIYTPGQEERSLESIQIVGDFSRGLQNRELWVEYQPKLECSSLELIGAEALVRWDHPKLGRLPPDKFVAAIEQAGGISQLTRWVIAEAASTLANWHARDLMAAMAVNISADDLVDDYLPPYLSQICAEYSIEPGMLTLEVTESQIMHDVESSLAVLARIREMGFRVAIDDFGTGHSALAQLKRLPVDELKIDKSFVLNIHDQRDEAVVRTAIELAHKFGLTAVAEGVEDEEGLVRLQQLGCETVQGFYFSRPLPAADFVAWARSWTTGHGADIVSLVEATGSARRARS